jgi:hypothetical protein
MYQIECHFSTDTHPKENKFERPQEGMLKDLQIPFFERIHSVEIEGWASEGGRPEGQK